MKKTFFLLIIFAYSSIINAQFSNQNIIANTLLALGDVQVVDVNNDGDLDIVTISDNSIVWYENHGSGNIDSVNKIITSFTNNIEKFDCVDMDNDGDIDFVVGTSAGSLVNSYISWIENINNGTLWAERIITNQIIGGSYSVKGVDMDNDGDMDIVSISSGDYKLAWYENLGGQNFSTQMVIELGSSSSTAQELCVSDFDADGDKDIITTYSAFGGVFWNQNMGNGVFAPRQILIQPWDKPYAISVFDINLDGINDLIYTSSDDNVTYYKLNNGAGNWSATGLVVGEITSRHQFDIDNDGDLDVISVGFNHNIFWNENLTSSFNTTRQMVGNVTFARLASGDLDNDGNIDIVYRGDNGVLGWHKNLGGNIDTVDTKIESKPVDSPKELFSIDIDNDGDNDVVSASFFDNKIAWYENLGQGVFGYQKIISDSAFGANGVYAADLDNDGDYDVVSASYNDNKIAWYENLGGGNFSAQKIIGLSYRAERVHIDDIDNDGDNDVVSISSVGRVIFHKNLGSGVFAQNDTIVKFNSGSDIFIADLNNDGLKDIIASSSGTSANIYWSENLGGGIFNTIPDTIGGQYLAQSIFASDYDNDGDIDVFSVGHITTGVAPIQVFENLGVGNFAPSIVVDNLNRIKYIYVDDIDGDGFDDILTVNGSSKVSWYKNNGVGSFGVEKVISYNVNFPLCVITSDLDNDGDNDVISSSFLDNKIAWYENFYSNPKLKGTVFYDNNQNGTLDSTEVGLSFIQTNLQPTSGYNFTDSLGNYFHSAYVGVSYVLSYLPFPKWGLTTDSSTYNVQLSTSNQIIDSLNFGFYPDTIITKIQSSLTGAFPRCNDTVNYWINIQNQGTTVPNGVIHLQLNDSISFISAATTPDSINGQNIYWNYDSLFFFSSEMINLQVQMPPFTSMGDTLTSYLTVNELDTFNNIVYTNIDTLEQILVCAYDPNDKSVTPKGVGMDGFIPQNQELEYLIRFQNTGNDTAITVMIRDQLDENLDWSTLQPIASSHNMQVWIEQDGKAVFKFENIMLPDSNVDFIGSQGFVKFSIQPDTGLAPLTPIYNTANIYFDYNPAVITNTVLNTIECYSAPQPVVSYNFPYLESGVTGNYTYQWYLNDTLIAGAINDTLMPLVDGNYTVQVTDSNGCYKISIPYNHISVGIEETQQLHTVVFPNPFNESTTILFNKNFNGEYDLLVYNIIGAEAKRINKITGNKITINKKEIGKGMFLAYLIHNQTGKRVFIEKLIVQ